MTYLPQHLWTRAEAELNQVQQDRIGYWRRQESWRRALAREHREQEIRLQSAELQTIRSATV